MVIHQLLTSSLDDVTALQLCTMYYVRESILALQTKMILGDISREEAETLESILVRLKSLTVQGRPNLLNISRYDVLGGAIRGFGRAAFSPRNGLSVRFVGEMGIDDGGPTREFYRLALGAIRDSGMFQGPEDSKYLNNHAQSKYMSPIPCDCPSKIQSLLIEIQKN